MKLQLLRVLYMRARCVAVIGCRRRAQLARGSVAPVVYWSTVFVQLRSGRVPDFIWTGPLSVPDVPDESEEFIVERTPSGSEASHRYCHGHCVVECSPRPQRCSRRRLFCGRTVVVLSRSSCCSAEGIVQDAPSSLAPSCIQNEQVHMPEALGGCVTCMCTPSSLPCFRSSPRNMPRGTQLPRQVYLMWYLSGIDGAAASLKAICPMRCAIFGV